MACRIKQRRVCSKEGKEVPYKEVAKGYEVSGGEYVLLTPDEIAAAAGDGAHRVNLEEFVCAGDIDPDFYVRTYYLGAGPDGEAAYRLLHDALARTDRAGIGRWVFHNREYLVAVRAREDLLTLHTMRFADEVVGPGDLDIAKPSRTPSKRETRHGGGARRLSARAVRPDGVHGHLPRGLDGADQAQGQGRGDRDSAARRDRARRPTCSPRWRRA